MTDPRQLDRLRRGFASLAAVDRPADDCPAAERIWRAVQGELSEPELRAVVDHTVDCGVCAEAWRIARAGADPVGGRVIALWRRPVVWAPLLAAAAIVVAILWSRRGGEDRPTYRGGDSKIESVMGESPTLPRDDALLRWAGPERARYVVVVSDADLRVLVRSQELDGRDYRVPADALTAVAPGQPIYWQIEATLPDGRRLRSPTFVATVR